MIAERVAAVRQRIARAAARAGRQPAEVTLVGEYSDIRRFLYEVETAEEFLIIEKVALSQPNAAQGGGQLEVALSVATYFLTDAKAGTIAR